MTSLLEKGGGTFAGIKMLLCENPLPQLDEAIAAAQEELARSNYYTEAYSAPLRRLLSGQLAVPERFIHINAGSELILRQRKILIKPLNNPQLGSGYMRVTTALPEDNKHFLDAMRAVLAES